VTSQPDLDAVSAATLAAIELFDDAINRHDLAAALAAMSDDAVWENTFPAPDGERYEGRDAIRAAIEKFFQESPHAHFETEDIFACGDRGVVRWRYTWIDQAGVPGYVRGVDVLRARDGKVTQCFSYVKG
jgi:ketosteroid isomerase-like protein